MDTRGKVIELVKQKGPLIPVLVAKEINTSILLASAYLSELVANKIIKISTVKVGGSPLYYMACQEHRLQDYYKNLHEKEQKAYLILKERRVLRDSSLEPVVRVALRNTKDFAIPLTITIGQASEIFWKWYLVPDKEAESLIKNILEQGVKRVPEQKAAERIKEKIEEKKEEIRKPAEERKPEAPKQDVLAEEQKPEKKFVDMSEIAKSSRSSALAQSKQAISECQKPKVSEHAQKCTAFPTYAQEHAPPFRAAVLDKDDSFLDRIKQFCERNKIEIVSCTVIKKNTEIELNLMVPSAVGSLQYYCKAKNKKRISDGDIASAFVQGQLKKLPVLFLSLGELSKKAKEMLPRDFKGVTVKTI